MKQWRKKIISVVIRYVWCTIVYIHRVSQGCKKLYQSGDKFSFGDIQLKITL